MAALRAPRPARALVAGLALAAAACALAPRAPAAPPEAVEAALVQSAPVETDLAEPGVAQAKDVWLEMVRGAKSTIDIAQFYVANEKDGLLEPVLRELEKAAGRGVKVRLLVSSKMLKNDEATLARFRALEGAQVLVYDLAKRTGGILHAKYWIVDGETIFVGSQNFDWRALEHIHELGVRVRDRALAARLAAIFERDAAIAAGREPAPAALTATAAPVAGPIELVASPAELNPPGVRPAIDALLGLIAGAKKRLQVQVLDYSTAVYKKKEPWTAIDDALRTAAARGVRVDLLVSHWNTEKPEIESLKALVGVPNVAVKVLTVPGAKRGFIPYARVAHSKYMVVDGETLWLGTSNWSRGYFLDSRNVELICKVPALAAQAAGIHERLWTSKHAEPVDPAKDYPKPRKGQ